MGLRCLLCYSQLAFSVENRSIVWQIDVIYYFFLIWKTQLFSLDSFSELCCYLERKMSHSSATVWKCCGHHWQSTLSRNTMWFQAYFLLWNKQETPLWNRQPFWFFSSRTYWYSSNQNPNRWKKLFSIALGSHYLKRLQDGVGEGFGLCGIKAHSPCSGHGACTVVKAETTAETIEWFW